MNSASNSSAASANGKVKRKQRTVQRKSLKDLVLKVHDKNKDTCFPQIINHHLSTLRMYLEGANKDEGPKFETRKDYQDLAIAKLFVDKLQCFKFKPDASRHVKKGKCEDESVPFLKAFHLTPEDKDMEKKEFFTKIKKGDILHLKVIGEESDKFNLIVLNKYDERERIIDYSVPAGLLKFNLNDLSLKESDLIRATVLGITKDEKGNEKCLMSLNVKHVPDEYKSVKLGLVKEKEIKYFPQDISQYSCLAEYLEAQMSSLPRIVSSCLTSLNSNPNNVGTFVEHFCRTEEIREVDTTVKIKAEPVENDLNVETEKIQTSINMSGKAMDLLESGNLVNALIASDEAVMAYPKNDIAIAIRGEIFLAMAVVKPSNTTNKAFQDFEEALRLNPHNQRASKASAKFLQQISESYIEENKYNEATQICQLLSKLDCDYEGVQKLLQMIKLGTEAMNEDGQNPVNNGKGKS